MIESGMYQCPVPGCEHQAGAITSVHYEGFHGLTLSEVHTRYGKPKFIRINPLLANKNVHRNWRRYDDTRIR